MQKIKLHISWCQQLKALYFKLRGSDLTELDPGPPAGLVPLPTHLEHLPLWRPIKPLVYCQACKTCFKPQPKTISFCNKPAHDGVSSSSGTTWFYPPGNPRVSIDLRPTLYENLPSGSRRCGGTDDLKKQILYMGVHLALVSLHPVLLG